MLLLFLVTELNNKLWNTISFEMHSLRYQKVNKRKGFILLLSIFAICGVKSTVYFSLSSLTSMYSVTKGIISTVLSFT